MLLSIVSRKTTKDDENENFHSYFLFESEMIILKFFMKLKRRRKTKYINERKQKKHPKIIKSLEEKLMLLDDFYRCNLLLVKRFRHFNIRGWRREEKFTE
jgi:hypothetical protein